MSILVLGVGNILLRDEGVGVRAVEALLARHVLPEGVEAIDGGTAGIDLLDLIAGRDHVILVDAVRGGRAPGGLVRLAGDEIPALSRARLSPHQLGLPEVLATLRLLGEAPGGLTLLGMEPADLDGGLDLSPEIAARLGDLVAMIVAELARLGVECPPAPPAARAGTA